MPTITTTPEAIERVAWSHGVPIEIADGIATCTYAGVTYRAEVGA